MTFKLTGGSVSSILLGFCCILVAGCASDGSLAPSAHSPTDTKHQQIVEWTAYGGDNASKYSAIDDITVANVDQLEIAWTHSSGDYSDGSGDWTFTSLQVTPLMADNHLFYCTPFGRVFSLNAETGVQEWVFDPGVSNKRSGIYPAVCRGVSLWRSSNPSATGTCQKRIIYGTRDAQLIALDSQTGIPCEDFGVNGRVSLREGISSAKPWEYYPTSPPFIIGNVAVVGALVPDNDRVSVPSGVVRAFNVKTGALMWAWEPVSANYRQRHKDSLGNTQYHLGSPNVWAPISGDPELGLVYVPTGNPSPDIYGGDRDGIDDLGSSVVALDAGSGELRWHFQTVHHDLWDYDVASQPSLFKIPGVANEALGLAQATKMGHIFLLNRENGEPLYPIEERAVPQGAVAGEVLSPTQPFPTHPAPLHLPAKLSEEHMDGFVYFDRKACQRELSKYRSEGMFTPPSLQGSIQYPATLGGINWGGITIDPINGILYANQTHMASVVQLIPRQRYDALNPSPGYPIEHYPMHGTPYGVKRFPLVSPLGAPCSPRPWGSLTAVDLKSGKTLWRKTLGNTRGLAPWPLWFELGSPNIGGAVATAGGLLFIGASADGYFRAFNSRTGAELWRQLLPYSANATPISYRGTSGGRQYIVVAAGGHGWSKPGDSIVAFALPHQ
jgi:quinoprotein glucose dehydrogenase